MDDYSLYGARLYNAKPEDAKRCSDAYERDSLKRAQDYGWQWTPTRQLVEIYEHNNKNRYDELRDELDSVTLKLYIAAIIEGVAITVISALLLLL